MVTCGDSNFTQVNQLFLYTAKVRRAIFKTPGVFKLGPEKVPEKASYDRAGIELFPEDGTKIKEKISKARRTFNASSGLGIKKSGLNMVSCGIIFWSVVVPTLTSGSECWILEVEDIENLMVFSTSCWSTYSAVSKQGT